MVERYHRLKVGVSDQGRINPKTNVSSKPNKSGVTQMAVNVKSNNQNQNQQQQHQQPRQGFTPNFGISSRLSVYGSGGEVFETLYEKLHTQVKFLNEEVKPAEKYAVIKLLKQNAGLNYSGIILVETLGAVTSAHILMVERTGDYPEKVMENVNNVRYEILRTPADALDHKYVAQAQAAVASALKISPTDVVVTDGVLVPNEFDVNSDVAVSDLMNNAFKAIHSENQIRVNDYQGISIPEMMRDNVNGKFMVQMYFNSEESDVLDQIGLPIRQDVCISLKYKANSGSDNRSVNQSNDMFDVVKTYGYVDFEYQGNQQQQGMYPSTQKFIPNFIITHIDSEVAPTADILMLGVASVMALNEDLQWMQAFRSTAPRKGESDYNDIGALNVEGNLENTPTGYGKKYDTKSKTFSMIEMNKFMQTLVRPNLVVSIDVPKAGGETWYTSIFNYVKNGDKGAFTRLMKGINALTNGGMSGYEAQPFLGISNRIHGGFYKDKNGMRDVRHLCSYLSISNYIADTAQDPALISQYTNTLYNSSLPTELRAAERKKYIDEMSNNTAVYKQYYDRLTFTGHFLSVLSTALGNAGFSPVFSNMGVANDMFARRSTVDFTSAMLDPNARFMGQNTTYGGFYSPRNYQRGY